MGESLLGTYAIAQGGLYSRNVGQANHGVLLEYKEIKRFGGYRTMPKALQIDPLDNVAVVLSEVKKGEKVLINLEAGAVHLTASSDIPFGHKMAVTSLLINEPIIKYGEEIGKAKTPIQPGDWVHLQNVYCERGRED